MAGNDDQTRQIPPQSARPPVAPVGAEPRAPQRQGDQPRGSEREPHGGAPSRFTIGDRGVGQHGGPGRFRLDLLQIAAWATGIYLLVSGLVAVARADFENFDLFQQGISVGGLQMTPLLGLILLVIGLLLLAGGTGEPREAALRFGGVVIGVIGVVWLIEPNAFNELLGVTSANGMRLLVIGVVLVVTSFTPPLDVNYNPNV